MTEKKAFDAAVIGGGLAGLTAAAYLAQAGRSVILLEKADQLGGRAQTAKKQGALFNMGPHALLREGPGMHILQELGVRPKGGTPSLNVIGIRQGKMVKLPTNAASMLASRAFTLGEKIELAQLMSRLARIDTEAVMGVSLQEWAVRHIRHARVREYVLALCRLWTYENDPAEQSAGYVLRQGQDSLRGVLYVDGGWQWMVDRLRERAEQAGAVVAVGRKAERIGLSEGRVASVQLSGGDSFDVHAVVVAAGPDDACRLVPGAEQTSLWKWKTEARPLYGACLDLAVRRLPRPRCTFAIGLDEPVYFSNHSAVIPLSEQGDTVVHLMKYNGVKSAGDPKADEKQLTRLLDLVQPGWHKEVAAVRYLPSMLIAHGSRSARSGGAGVAPGPAVREIRGLYVAGDWVGAEGRLAEAAMASARRAAQEILREFR